MRRKALVFRQHKLKKSPKPGKALITGHCGPKAFRVLEAAAIKVFNTDAPTVAEALARWRAGELTENQNRLMSKGIGRA